VGYFLLCSFALGGGFFMSEKRLAVISIMVEDRSKSETINALLSEFGTYVVGRMGVPYKERNVAVICVIVDAPTEVINQLTGKIGMLSGVSAKTLMSKN
jgi:putative iron-only hydrogenase system regulator